MKSLLHVGADAEKSSAALPAITSALVTILSTPAGDDVKKAAIHALSRAFSVEDVSIMNCNFTGNTSGAGVYVEAEDTPASE
jgi:hypothetical protein